MQHLFCSQLATSPRNNKIALARVRPRASRCAPTACVRARRPEPPLRWAHCRTRRRGRWPGSWPTVRKSRSQRGLHPLTPWPCTYEMNEVIRGHQRSLSGNQRSSEVISGHSQAIKGHQRQATYASLAPPVVTGTENRATFSATNEKRAVPSGLSARAARNNPVEVIRPGF